MWKLKEIYIENIVSFREAKLEIEQGVATLIFGRNEDNPSQPCNGSGKSSLVEAISFALTGEQLRKVKSIEEIINDNADEAFVSLTLENDYDNTSLVINRTISRKSPQVIECHKFDINGDEIEKDKTIQPTVLDYNRFILNEIGLTKDDIYNNYILCDNKYESFFDCSDRSKKEVINRFSNGAIIDESIERVQKDMGPVESELVRANNQVINIKGSISAIENELVNADEKQAQALDEVRNRIFRLEDQILQCRERIADYEEKQDKAEKRMEVLVNLQKEVDDMERSDISLLDAYGKIKVACEENDLGTVTDFVELSEKYKNDLHDKQQKVNELKNSIFVAEEGAVACRGSYDKSCKDYNRLRTSYEKLDEEEKKKIDKLCKELESVDDKLYAIEKKIKSQKTVQSELEVKAGSIITMINGAVECPKCGHRFVLNNDESVDELNDQLAVVNSGIALARNQIKDLYAEYDGIDEEGSAKDKEIDRIENEMKLRSKELDSLYENVHSLLIKANNADSLVAAMKRDLTHTQNDLDSINGKIEVLRNRLFGEMTGILEGRILNGKSYIEQQLSSIEFEKGKIMQYKATRRELMEAPESDFKASLQQSLEKYKDELEKAEKTAANVQSEYDTLKGQEINFTMFKSYIARKKIDALSLIVNDFLEKIGSDIRLRLEGFSITKSGKLRDKISVQVMRDGIDCGSYHKFSGGEKARLNLACILSLHTLTNSNCEDGKGLDFIIIDELLDKSDEVGMTTYCDALNKLKQTSLLITQGGISEGYPHKLLVTKRQGVSTISR